MTDPTQKAGVAQIISAQFHHPHIPKHEHGIDFVEGE
jgi:hypothetical protein